MKDLRDKKRDGVFYILYDHLFEITVNEDEELEQTLFDVADKILDEIELVENEE